MRALLGERLVHFLLLGALLFVAHDLVSGRRDDGESRVVVVDRNALLDFVQYRSKAFDPDMAEKRLSAMSAEERERLVDDLLREEILYREALALGLGEEDPVVKRRLIQKLEFITRGFATTDADPTESDVASYFAEHREEYAIEGWVTFTHVFFDSAKRTPAEARARAEAELRELHAGRVSFSAAIGRGDRFLYHRNYVERGHDTVRSHFGPEVAKSVFEGNAEDGVWRGPLASPYGFHLVLVEGRAEGRLPSLDEVRSRVVQEARDAAIRARTEAALQEIVDRYEVRIDLSAEPTG